MGNVLFSWGLGSAGLGPGGAQSGTGLLEGGFRVSHGEWSGCVLTIQRVLTRTPACHLAPPGWGECGSAALMAAPLVSVLASGQSPCI